MGWSHLCRFHALGYAYMGVDPGPT
jgi:hypothetical protein